MKRRKSAPAASPKPARWFAPDEKTFDKFVASGVPKRQIYKGWKGEVPGKFHMRAGEYLGVVDGFRAFGGKRAIRKAVEEVHKDGATILDIGTGQNSRDHGVTMHAEAIAPRRSLPESEKLARADARRKKDGKMLKRDAYDTWHGPGTVEQKEEATGWSRAALYAAFGRTGAPAGRPPSK